MTIKIINCHFERNNVKPRNLYSFERKDLSTVEMTKQTI